MSEYGSVKKPDMNIAQLITQGDGIMPGEGSNVMEWADDPTVSIVQKYARKRDHSNIHFRIDKS
jgi:hypothetical protein